MISIYKNLVRNLSRIVLFFCFFFINQLIYSQIIDYKEIKNISDFNKENSDKIRKSKIIGIIDYQNDKKYTKRFDYKGRIIPSYYDTIVYSVDDKIEKIRYYNVDIIISYDSMNRVKMITNSIDTILYTYSANKIHFSVSYIRPKIATYVPDFLINDVRLNEIGKRLYFNGDIDVAYNREGDLIYQRFNYSTDTYEEYYYHNNRLIKQITSSLTQYSETAFVYSKYITYIYANNTLFEKQVFDNDNYLITIYDDSNSVKRIEYLDENLNVLAIKQYYGDNFDISKIKYIYEPDVLIYDINDENDTLKTTEIYTKEYCKNPYKATRSQSEGKYSFFYNLGTLQSIIDYNNKIQKTYSFRNDTLSSFTESDSKTESKIFYLFDKQRIVYIKGFKTNVEISDDYLLKVSKDIQSNAQKLEQRAKKYEFGLYVFGTKITEDNQIFKLDSTDRHLCDSIYIDNSFYIIKKVNYNGTVNGIDWARSQSKVTEVKFEALEMSRFIHGYWRTIAMDIFIEDKNKKTMRIRIIIK